MEFTVEERDGVAIVRIPDDITTENVGDLKGFFQDSVNPAYARIILDMEDVDYFCSSAYGVMLRCLEATRGKGGDMVLARASESVKRLFEVTRLTTVVRLEDTIESALRWFQRSSPGV